MTKPKKPASSKQKAAKSSGSGSIADVAHPNTSPPSDTSKPIITHRPMIKDPMMVDDEPEQQSDDKTLPLKQPDKPKLTPPDEPDDKTEKEAEEKTPQEEPEDSPPPPKKQKQDEDAAAAKTKTEEEAKVRKLIDSKKYYLPINAVEHRRSARFAVVGILLALVLAVAWVDVALDAGLIELGGVKPVTHLFSN